MKKQQITPASLASAAPNSARKGLQQYFTPQPWAAALGAALPPHRRAIFDPFVGNGSLVRGLANDTTRDALGLDLDPTATLGGDAAWAATTAPNVRRHLAHGDVLDLLPLLEDTATKFDLLALNPPFSLNWPVELLPEWLADGVKTRTVSSTLVTLRMANRLLSGRGEAVLIGNASTLHTMSHAFPNDFAKVWLNLTVPSFYPGTDPKLQIGVLFIGSAKAKNPGSRGIDRNTPLDEVAAILETMRRSHFTAPCIEEPWQHDTDSANAFDHCADEMERRRNPAQSNANIIVDGTGRLRTWVSGFQQRNLKIPTRLADYLRKITRCHPVELTIQHATRAGLQEVLDSGIWTIDPAARAAIDAAMRNFHKGRSPLAPLSLIQRIGWLDDCEEIECREDFAHFRAGERYPLSSQTVEWKRSHQRPRYRAGKRDTETVLTKGTDLKITIHGPGGDDRHFTYNPANLADASPTRNASIHDLGGENHHTLDELAAHFIIPEVPDITTVFPAEFEENLRMIDQLEQITP